MPTTATAPRIYVACLSSYVSGYLHGAWIDGDQDGDDIQAEIDKMLKASPALLPEEWEIHDHEGWGGIDPAQVDLDELVELAEILESHPVSFPAYWGNLDSHMDDLPEIHRAFEESYRGCWPSLEDFCEENYCEDIPDHIGRYVDWSAVAEEWFDNEYWFDRESYDQVHIFDRVSAETGRPVCPRT